MKPTAQLFQPDPVSGYITIFVEGKQHTIHATDSNFASAVTAFEASDWDGLYNILNPAQVFQNLYAKYEQIEVKHGNVYVNDEPISSLIAGRILDFLAKGVDCLPVFKFITKLNLNPSARAVNELYTFLEHKFLPLTDNGNFLAYKALRSDYTDVHTGKFNNSVDNVLEMPRNKVDDNKEVGCSYGFHAGTLEYARGFRPCSGKLVLVEINPADVVSIPTDCECQKLRTCKYKVVAEYEVPLEDLSYESRFTTEYDDDVDREWDDDEDDNEECEICSECREQSYGNCCDCDCCEGCCDCDGCMADPEPEEPKTEIQLELNLDNKMTSNWADARFQYLVMLPWLYAHRRPALGNALKDFYKDVDDLHNVNPIFAILKQFTSDEDVYKIYKEYTNS